MINKQIQLEADLASNSEEIELEVELAQNNQQIDVDLASSILYVFSPSAKVELLNNGNYLITIIDKDGTTTAEIPVLTEVLIKNLLNEYFEQNPINEQYIQQQIQNILKDLSDIVTENQMINYVAENSTKVVQSQINGNIKVNNQEINVYTLPNTVITNSDILVLDGGHADTNYS